MALDHDPHAGDDEPELLDRIDARRVLRADRAGATRRLLDETFAVIAVVRMAVAGAIIVTATGRFA
jgi:hypothetical protein